MIGTGTAMAVTDAEGGWSPKLFRNLYCAGLWMILAGAAPALMLHEVPSPCIEHLLPRSSLSSRASTQLLAPRVRRFELTPLGNESVFQQRMALVLPPRRGDEPERSSGLVRFCAQGKRESTRAR